MRCAGMDALSASEASACRQAGLAIAVDSGNDRAVRLVLAGGAGALHGRPQRPCSDQYPLSSRDAERSRSAHRIFEDLEGDRVSDAEIVEGRAGPKVTAMKEDLALIAQADEAVTLTDQEPCNPTGRRPPTKICPQRLTQPFRGALALGAVEVFAAHIW